jgi:hypothetical protein
VEAVCCFAIEISYSEAVGSAAAAAWKALFDERRDAARVARQAEA